MKIPVSVRTDRHAIKDLAETPHIGGLLVLLIALGPPTLVGLLVVLGDLTRYLISEESWGFLALDPPFLGDRYFGLVFALSIPFNLLLSYRFGVRVAILCLPAWAFGAMSFLLFVLYGNGPG